MENNGTFIKYLGSFGKAISDFYDSLDDILSNADYDYKRGNITIEKLAIIAKMVYYFESIKPFEQ